MSNHLAARPLIETYCTLYKRGEYRFIAYNSQSGLSNQKQELALRLLEGSEKTEIMYGGAAGGAKSWTGCVWLLFNCLLYPETRWFIGRSSLKDIRDSTLITFGKVARRYGLRPLTDYKYNGQDNFIVFPNGSRVDMLDLSFMPSDPMYERLGSKEYTGGFLEECGQIHFNAFDVLKTRIGRHLNDKYHIKAKLFLTCNPKKNWIYTYFVKPEKEGNLPPERAFIRSLVTDNPYRESDYLERLQAITDKVQRARLLDGNFEYDDDPSALIDYDAILSMWTNAHVEASETYLTCDVARYGRDKSVVVVWKGWRVVYVKIMDTNSITELADLITNLRTKYQIPAHHCLADEDGVGGGLVDMCRIKGFVNNARPLPVRGKDGLLKEENFANLKSQCYFKLSDQINMGGLFVEYELNESDKQSLIEELEQVKQKDMDSDKKRSVLAKDEVKAIIGRSPDLSDVLMMRIFFELKRGKVPQTW